MANRIVLHLDLDAFFASVEQQEKPWLRNKPVFVAGNNTHRTVVATCSYEARRYGVKTGMPLGQARRLCPEAVVVVGDPAKYVNISRKIFRYCQKFTPMVEVFSIDEAFLELTHVPQWYSRPQEAACQLKEWILEQFGLTCSVGIAPNKLLAKLASGLEKPDGLTQILDGGGAAHASLLQKFLEDLPVENLCGIGEKTRQALFSMGIWTCGQLGRAPVGKLVNRFGAVGETLKQMGQGLDESPVVPIWIETPAKSMGHSHTLDEDTSDFETIKATLLMLSEKVARRLRDDDSRGRTVVLTVRYSDFETISRHKSFESYTNDGYQIYQSALWILEVIAWRPRKIRLLGVSVSHLVTHEEQLDWLNQQKKRERLNRAIDQIHDRWDENILMRATHMTSNARERHYQLKQTKGRMVPLLRVILWLYCLNYLPLTTYCLPVWAQELAEEPLAGAGKRGEIVSIPKAYGDLVSTVESNGVHYLYFQDEEGNIRVFLLGVKGIASRARVDLEALPHSVYKIPRSVEKQDSSLRSE